MEIGIISLTVLLGIAILCLGAISIVHMIVTSKDRKDLEKMIKASTLQEYVAMTSEDDDIVEEEEEEYVPIEKMGEYLNK